MNATAQMINAAVLGAAAFKRGIICSPCLDAKLLQMLSGRSVGVTPVDEAPSDQLMITWTKGWMLASEAKGYRGSTHQTFNIRTLHLKSFLGTVMLRSRTPEHVTAERLRLYFAARRNKGVRVEPVM